MCIFTKSYDNYENVAKYLILNKCSFDRSQLKFLRYIDSPKVNGSSKHENTKINV